MDIYKHNLEKSGGKVENFSHKPKVVVSLGVNGPDWYWQAQRWCLLVASQSKTPTYACIANEVSVGVDDDGEKVSSNRQL